MIESIDAVGRKVYSKTDVMGRIIETAVWNPASNSYGNFTATTYNALSKVVTTKDGGAQTTAVYYNSFGKPKMTVFPDGTYSVVYYDDGLRAFKTADVTVPGRVAISTYDALGRVARISLKASDSGTTTYDTFYDYDSHDDLWVVQNGSVNGDRTSGTAKVTFTYDSLHRLKTEKLDVPATSTPTFTPTDTPTDTPSATPTNTPTDTPTDTPTNTPSDTPTNTPTATPTNTLTPDR